MVTSTSWRWFAWYFSERLRSKSLRKKVEETRESLKEAIRRSKNKEHKQELRRALELVDKLELVELMKQLREHLGPAASVVAGTLPAHIPDDTSAAETAGPDGGEGKVLAVSQADPL